MWTYLPYGPFADPATYRHWLDQAAGGQDPLFFAIVAGEPARAAGVAAFLRAKPASGSIEVGHLAFSPALQRTTAATEAMALMMATAFDELGYRRYEWKCDALNAPSRRAALRLGFVYEGTFRQATVVRGHNRDTAWFSVTDAEWPRVKEAFRRWLEPANFGPDGRQYVSLSALPAPATRLAGAPHDRLVDGCGGPERGEQETLGPVAAEVLEDLELTSVSTPSATT